MEEIKVNDYVKRKSYNADICFRVKDIIEIDGCKVVHLKGINVRLMADCSLDDLVRLKPHEVLQERHDCILLNRKILKRIQAEKAKRNPDFRRSVEVINGYYEVPGKVLHLDGDEEYLHKCLSAYQMLDVPVKGFHIKEELLPDRVEELIKEYSPNILVLTGHDAVAKKIDDYMDISNYRTSEYFVQAVKKARMLEANRDDLVIIAGACQSFYEALIESGANFASSPKRIMIHAFDPVYLAEKIAYTPICERVALEEAVKNTITGRDGMGGVDTLGQFRLGYPKSAY